MAALTCRHLSRVSGRRDMSHKSAYGKSKAPIISARGLLYGSGRTGSVVRMGITPVSREATPPCLAATSRGQGSLSQGPSALSAPISLCSPGGPCHPALWSDFRDSQKVGQKGPPLLDDRSNRSFGRCLEGIDGPAKSPESCPDFIPDSGSKNRNHDCAPDSPMPKRRRSFRL
jgi:hypothetical protein